MSGGRFSPDPVFSVRRAAEEQPDDVALLAAGEEIRWRELAARVEVRAAALFRRFGEVSPFGLVGTLDLETLVTVYAAIEIGAPVVLLHPRWTAVERGAYLRRLGLGDAVSTAELADSEVSADAIDGVGEPAPEDLLAVVATSGSTAEPKGVALSRRAFAASASAHGEHLGWAEEDRWLLSLPLAHVGGLSIVTRCLAARRTVVLPPAAERFDAEVVLRWIDTWRVTLLSVVPTMLRRLLEARPGGAPESLRLVLVGGAPSPPGRLEEAAGRRWPVAATYGLTEACSQVATQRPGDAERGLAGAALLPGVEGRIRQGVLQVRGPMLMSGYLPGEPNPWRLGAGLDDGGWLPTGDLARFDNGGRLHVLGRADGVVISGGENVHPQEVEAALLAHPDVEAACVVGVDDAEWGQVPAAALVLREARGEGEWGAVLDAFLRPRLAAFKIPRRWEVLPELPTTPSGKVDRRAVGSALGDSAADP